MQVYLSPILFIEPAMDQAGQQLDDLIVAHRISVDQ